MPENPESPQTRAAAAEAARTYMVWQRLRKSMPEVTRRNRKSNRPETVQEVRLTLRRKNGQWLAACGDHNRTGSTDLDALEALADALDRNA